MAAEDELAIPALPEAMPNDPEDVAWALSTAEAMWARGDLLEGIKWVRKAAEAASEVEDDERALELAKAASELTSSVAGRSRGFLGDGPGVAGKAPPDFVGGVPSPHNRTAIQPPQGPSSTHPTKKPSRVPPKAPGVGGPPALPPNANSPRETRRSSMPPPMPSVAPALMPPTSSWSAPRPLPVSSVPLAPSALVPAVSSAPSPSVPHAPYAPHAPSGRSVPSALAPQVPAASTAPFGKSGGPIASRSVPPGPIPLPSRASVPPRAMSALAPPAAHADTRAAPRPLVPSASATESNQGPPTGRGATSSRGSGAPKSAKGRRRSRENLDTEARAASLLDKAPGEDTIADKPLVDEMSSRTLEVPVAQVRGGRGRSRPDANATEIGRPDRLDEARERERSAEQWDALPTQNLTGGEMDEMSHGERKTATFAIPSSIDVSVPSSISIPVAVVRPATNTVHDPKIQTSQAVRVVVWRDGTGVHVAPAGTVVSSITIDAVLVVLEPSADLTAWLSQRER